MSVNKVIVNGVAGLDLTNDTVNENENLLSGAIAHNAAGETIIGKVTIINSNSFDNPDFKINQRGLSEYVLDGIDATGLDRWIIQSAFGRTTVTVLPSGIKIENTGVNSGIRQPGHFITEGKTYTISAEINGIRYSTQITPVKSNEGNAQAYSGTPYFAAIIFHGDTWTIYPYVTYTENCSVIIKDVKLELGSVATQFIPPNPATELVKCQRYYQIRSTGDISPVDLRPSMRITPTVTQLDNGNYAYNAEMI